ncbi:hypothetical protein SRB5_08600 [Streptomyces sp. RB5]|uniref:Uncharacterized protein n=1 Tax=Streptomyces smaragdinus TaxID=2585196 RepID=A0A7K0CBB2_9ACTN|nr:hypothetical protein [Streptomyces smaragdinus]MQY10747.1 hypothetical protein [Streptomyces smaragdinus]
MVRAVVDAVSSGSAGFFGGPEVLEPGMVSVSRWRPGPDAFGEAAPIPGYGVVARKP